MTPPGEKSNPLFKSDLVPLIVITLFVVVLMWPFTLNGRALMPDTWKSIHPWARGVDVEENQASIYDTVIEYGPWFEYSQNCLKEGRVPHWNPWQFCGAPLYANRLVPYFFPPFIVAELIAHPHKIIGWFQFFNLILSGWGMYFLLRRWRMAQAVATAGSVLWLTCGVHFLPFPSWTLGVVGFPWLLWALEGFIEKPGIRSVAIAGFIAGLIMMVGYPVFVVHLGYFTGIYFICRWWVVRRTGPGRLHWTIPLLVIAAVCVLGLGLSSIANLPAWKYSQETFRQVEGFGDRAFEQEKRELLADPEEGGLDPMIGRFGQSMDVLLPINGRGNIRAWQYGGVLLYLLAILGILAGRARARLIGILGILFAITVWIPHVIVFLLDILPGWKVTVLLPFEVVNLIACLLAAFGIEALTRGEWIQGLNEKVLLATFSVWVVMITAWFFQHAPVIELSSATGTTETNLLAGSAFHILYLAAIILLTAAILFLASFRPGTPRLRWILISGVLVFSMITFWYLQPVYSDRDYTPETPFTEWLGEATGEVGAADGNRVARWALLPLPFSPHRRAKSPFTPNLHLTYDVQDVGGYDSLVPRRYIEYCALFDDQFFDYRALIAFRARAFASHPRFRAIGVRWIISQGELPDESREGCTLVWDDRFDGSQAGTDESDDFIQVWEVDDPAPRAFLTRKVAYLSDPMDDPLAQLTNWAVREEEMVVVEDPHGENWAFAFSEEEESGERLVLEGSEVTLQKDDPEHLVIDVHAPDECYLILRDGWFPEWSAFVDGEPSPIFRADAAFRAVRIPAGDHVVELRYVPRSFKTGMLITIVTLFLLILFCIFPSKITTQQT